MKGTGIHGERAALSLGNLRNRGDAGLWYLNGRNRLGTERWNIGSRLTGWNHQATSAVSTPRAWTRRGMPSSTE